MQIQFTPQRSDESLAIDLVPNGLIVNGTFYDFSEVTGEIQPVGPLFTGDASSVLIILPVGADPTQEESFPDAVLASTLGAIAVPGHPRAVDSEGNTILQEITQIQSGIEGASVELSIVVVSNVVQVISAPPDIVTMRQARLALYSAGKLAQIETAIEALTEPTKTAAKIEWEYSQEVHRNRPFVQMLAAALSLTQEDLDNLFYSASTF